MGGCLGKSSHFVAHSCKLKLAKMEQNVAKLRLKINLRPQKMGSISLVKIGFKTVEIFLIFTNVAWINVSRKDSWHLFKT